MVTCYLQYQIDPEKVREFEEYGKMWIKLVNTFGGMHHGYFLPHESANNIAYALFTFESLASYEKYRQESVDHPECRRAYEFAVDTKCILSYDRRFVRPVFN